MSGGVSFESGVFWGKAGWCYRAARDAICEELRVLPNGRELAEELSAESHPAQWCEYLDIEGWPTEKKKLLFDAIYRCAARISNDGPNGWTDPSLFPGFLDAIQELVGIAQRMEQKSETA